MADAYVCAFFKVTGRDAEDLFRTSREEPLRQLEQFCKMAAAGRLNVRGGFTAVDSSGTNPAGSIAVTALNVSAGDTITFDYMGGSVVLTAGTDFAVDTSGNSAQAVLIQKCIQEHDLLGTLLDVTESSGTLTLTATFPGGALEAIDMATSDATAFALTQIGVGTAGVDGAAEYYFRGRHRSGVGS